MQYRKLGKWGLKVSVIGMGGWVSTGSESLDFKASRAILNFAIDQGVNFIDLADSYAGGEAETTFGKILKVNRRADLVISSKVYWPMSENINDRGLSRKHIMESIDASLRRLGTDYLDLYLCHMPDSDVPLEETVAAMDDLVRAGKILYWGTSNWNALEINAAMHVVAELRARPPIAEQSLYNLFERDVVEGALEDTLAAYGTGLIVWSALCRGILTGKYNDGIPEDSRAKAIDQPWFYEGITPERIAKTRQLTALAADLGLTTSTLALAWVLANPVVSSALTGATRVEQVKENIAAAHITLTPDVLAQIETIATG